MPNYNLSPSDFSYMWDQCRRCFWLKHKTKLRQPGIFPRVFTQIDGAMRAHFEGRNLKVIFPELRSGIFETKTEWVESKPMQIGKNSLTIRGKIDALIAFDKGEFGVIDFKCSGDLEKAAGIYQRQLNGYAFGVENSKGSVTQLGLIMYAPPFDFQSAPTARGAALIGDLKWIPIQRDDAAFMKFLAEVSDCLSGPMPQSGILCDFCKYAQLRKSE